MNISSKKILGISFIFAAIILVSLWFFLARLPKHIDLTNYVPATSLAFVEINNLPTTINQLSKTQFWEKTSKALGFPEQLLYLQDLVNLTKTLNVGPDELVIVGRAQIGLVVTDMTAESSLTTDNSGLELSLTPQYTLLIKANSSTKRVENIINSKLPSIAKKIFRQEAKIEEIFVSGIATKQCSLPEKNKKLFVTNLDDLIFVSNNLKSLESCLDSTNQKSKSLAQNSYLNHSYKSLTKDKSLLFAFVSPEGLGKFAKLGLAFVPEKLTFTKNNITEQIVTNLTYGLAYSTDIQDSQLTDRYLLFVKPELLDSIRPEIPNKSLNITRVLPSKLTECTAITLNNPDATIANIQQQISANSNVVISFATKEILKTVREQFGIAPNQNTSNILGNEFAYLILEPKTSGIWLAQVQNKISLLPILDHYLRTNNATIKNENYRGIEIAISTDKDEKAVLFIEDFVAVGNILQLKKLCDFYLEGNTIAKMNSPKWSIFDSNAQYLSRSYQNSQEELGLFLLTIVRLAHCGDATIQRLQDPSIKELLNAFESKTSFTELRPEGIYTEVHSAAGNLARIGAFIGPEQPLVPIITK